MHDQDQLAEAHLWCIRAVRDALVTGQKVVVSNVSHRRHDVQRFVELADTAVVIKLTSQYGSVHQVPEEKLRKMQDAWEDYPGEIVA